jgi:hypothetical protein
MQVSRAKRVRILRRIDGAEAADPGVPQKLKPRRSESAARMKCERSLRDQRLSAARCGASACLRVANHFPHRHVEPVADALECGELHVFLPALDRAVVGTVHLDAVREAFLAVLGLFAMPADDFADAALEGSTFHGVNHKRRLRE